MGLNVALIGAGAMGFAIGSRLCERGHRLAVLDRNPPKVQALAAKGATGASSAAGAAAGADYVITCLNNASGVESVIFGTKGAAGTARSGTLIIDMSSIDPESTRALAERATAAGLRWVDSPLSGGASKALTGQLTLMAGGAEKDVDDARALLQDLAANYTHMGPSGAGQATKLINQVLCGIGFLAVAEATQLALEAGVAAAKSPAALTGGRADSAILQE
jgi:2-hydroxy-3-oxopropionate reductase